MGAAPSMPQQPVFVPPSQAAAPAAAPSSSPSFSALPKLAASVILDAAAGVQGRSKSGEGRQARQLAKTLGVGVTTLYEAKKLLKYGGPGLIGQVRDGTLSLKKACKLLNQKERAVEENVG